MHPPYSSIFIRDERPGDESAISEVTRAAFAGHPHSQRTEHLIIQALRAAGGLTLSLVAETEGRIVGHIAFSPVRIGIGSIGWYGLGPVSVEPDRQKSGIGTSLVMEGLDRLREMGAQGCVVLGDPVYYQRFGFERDASRWLVGLPPEYFLSIQFGDQGAHGEVVYHDAFRVQA